VYEVTVGRTEEDPQEPVEHIELFLRITAEHLGVKARDLIFTDTDLDRSEGDDHA
jgi:hypothetical protein